MNNQIEVKRRIAAMDFWSGNIDIETVSGGITNLNFRVTDHKGRYFVRTGVDIPVHGVMRFNEQAASRAAAQVGISPSLLKQEPGILVFDFIEGTTLDAEDIRHPDTLEPLLQLIRKCHHEIPDKLTGPILIFWVFHVIRSYLGEVAKKNRRCVGHVPSLQKKARLLERCVGPVEIVFGHNDLLAANFIHDNNHRLWLVDWDYAGYNSPLFDLANLSSNNDFNPSQDDELLARYFKRPVNDQLRLRFNAMKCASLLREALWSMVSEVHSSLEFDYVAYSEKNHESFLAAFRQFEQSLS